MAGLLDFDDPQSQFLTQLASGLLANGGYSTQPKSFGQIVGAAMPGAMQAGQAAQQSLAEKRKREKEANEAFRKDSEFRKYVMSLPPQEQKLALAMGPEYMKEANKMHFPGPGSQPYRGFSPTGSQIPFKEGGAAGGNGDIPLAIEATQDGRLVAVPTRLGAFQEHGVLPVGGAGDKQLRRATQYAPTQADISAAREGGKTGVEYGQGLFEKATVAERGIPKVDMLIDHLKTSDAITGFGAEFFNGLQRAKQMFWETKQSDKTISDTELLDVVMGSEVFPLISALGIGARGMDTPAEREFMRKVLTGEISLNKTTLIRMAELRKKGLEDTLSAYNEAVRGGDLNRFFETSRIRKRELGGNRNSSMDSGGWSATVRK